MLKSCPASRCAITTMVDYWMGRADFIVAVEAGDLTVVGPRALVRALPTWITRSLFAPVPPPAQV